MGGPWAWLVQGGEWVHTGDVQSTWGWTEGRSVRHGAPKGLITVTYQYTFGARGCIRVAWGHGHGVQGDTEWPVACGMWMGHGQSLVWVSGMQS